MSKNLSSASTWPDTSKIRTGCLLVLTAILVAATLAELRDIMIPFVLAIFLTYLVTPAVDFLELNGKMPRLLALAIIFLATLVGVGLVALVIAVNIGELIQGADSYRARILSLVGGAFSFLESLGVNTDRDKVIEAVRNLPFFQILGKAASGLLKGFSTATLVLIFLLFLMTGTRSSTERVGIYREIDQKIRRYIGTKVGISLATGILTWLTLGVAGVELSFLLALLTFLLNFIPTLGSIFAVLLPVPVLLIQFSNPVTTGAIIAVLGLIQFVLGNVIEPKLMGQSLDLHPATILLSLAFWGSIWGAVGMFLAVPLLAILKIVLGRIEATLPLSELMAGRLPK